MQLAERMSRIGVESAFDVLVRARALEAQGRSVIHLEIGEPDFPSPPHVIDAAKTALDQGWTHYGPTQGSPNCVKPSPPTFPAPAASASARSMYPSSPAASPSSSSPCWPCLSPATR